MTKSPNPSVDFEALTAPLQKGLVALTNMQRQKQADLDYVQFVINGDLPALPQGTNFIQQRFLGKADMSLLELERAFERIGNDSRTKGVILKLTGFEMSLADLQTLRDSIGRLRAKGKKVVCWAQGYALKDYFVASACDEILLQPGGNLFTLGLLSQQLFLKEGLAEIGVSFDSVAITPYKGALDTLTRTEPSEEGAEQTNRLLDSTFNVIVNGIAAERHMETDDVKAMIDEGAFTDLQALEKGYVDGLVLEEGLQAHLNTEHIVLWEKADDMILLPEPEYHEKYVAVLRVGGSIINGESANPPVDIPLPFVGGERMGDLTVTQQIRNLMHNERVGAFVLFIDSRGGSATASEAMASALDELAKKIPVVVFMNAVAASGGYYIATPADWIVAQPGTITGSIGVIAGKALNNETLKKLKFNPVYYMRGENSNMFAPIEPFTEAQREKVRESIQRTYEQFIQRVADARKMKTEQVDAIGGGRVWTGEEALENGLIDQLGGLHEAVAKARELANLPDTATMHIIRGSGKPLPAQLAEQANPAATLLYWQENLRHITSGKSLMMMPFEFKI